MKQVIIFGASGSGIAAKRHLGDEANVLAFSDNDPAKFGQFIDGIKVISPEQINQYDFQFIFIASEFFEQIEEQLLSANLCLPEQIKVLPASVIKPLRIGKDTSTADITLSILQTLAEILNDNACQYYVDAGTLLGIHRDNALIPWDDDLDFACSSAALPKVKQVLEDNLHSLNAITQQQWQVVECFADRDFGAVKSGDVRGLKLSAIDCVGVLPLVDVFVKYIDGERMDYVLSSRGISMPSKHVKETCLRRFSGFDIRFPSDVEEYLTLHYGDWQTPKQDWDLSMLENATVFE